MHACSQELKRHALFHYRCCNYCFYVRLLLLPLPLLLLLLRCCCAAAAAANNWLVILQAIFIVQQLAMQNRAHASMLSCLLLQQNYYYWLMQPRGTRCSMPFVLHSYTGLYKLALLTLRKLPAACYVNLHCSLPDQQLAAATAGATAYSNHSSFVQLLLCCLSLL
jgi:hypothetical protein